MIKRYDFIQEDGCAFMDEVPDGDYINYKEYDEMRIKYEKLSQTVQEILDLRCQGDEGLSLYDFIPKELGAAAMSAMCERVSRDAI